ncbi:DUF559 domain-containing protein [Microbacterium sp. 22242]|uniref:DUF559 domain-containing protein n=1 Tax=Microbacterium sp. 22242 TaxID=3453896 RepID=UPI003F85F6F8
MDLHPFRGARFAATSAARRQFALLEMSGLWINGRGARRARQSVGMEHSEPLPFGKAFTVREARMNGVSRSRLRRQDLRAPFHGVRMQIPPPDIDGIDDPYEHQRRARVTTALEYAPRLHTGHFFSHQTAVSIYGGPLPLQLDDQQRPAPSDALALHVCAWGSVPLPRTTGVTAHRSRVGMTEVREHSGFRVSSPAATWASLGELPVMDLVALGDYFCRRWRPGIGRRHVGRAPLCTVDELQLMMDAGRRRGIARLREALPLIREDAWSPRESRLRCMLVAAGLPEPELNIDVFDAHGSFLGCVDMVYPGERVIVEYLGMLHGKQWARDVERTAALRAAGWTVIEVTSVLLHTPEVLIRRIRAALGLLR